VYQQSRQISSHPYPNFNGSECFSWYIQRRRYARKVRQVWRPSCLRVFQRTDSHLPISSSQPLRQKSSLKRGLVRSETVQLLKRLFDSFKREISRLKQRTLLIVLLVGLVQGLLYVFLIPPWWHNDEPGHFEFAWQIVHFDHWPQFEEFDEAMRRKVAASMLRSGYYDVINYQPDLASLTPVYIGVAPQTTNYPLYYLVASLPLRVLGKADFAVQDRAVRLMSLGMFLLALWAAWKALGELLPEGHPAQWMTVLFLALLPGFTDTMTSISDDAGAALVFSIFVWVGLRILRRGLSFSRSMALIVSLALCYWTKSTTGPPLRWRPSSYCLRSFATSGAGSPGQVLPWRSSAAPGFPYGRMMRPCGTEETRRHKAPASRTHPPLLATTLSTFIINRGNLPGSGSLSAPLKSSRCDKKRSHWGHGCGPASLQGFNFRS